MIRRLFTGKPQSSEIHIHIWKTQKTEGKDEERKDMRERCGDLSTGSNLAYKAKEMGIIWSKTKK